MNFSSEKAFSAAEGGQKQFVDKTNETCA